MKNENLGVELINMVNENKEINNDLRKSVEPKKTVDNSKVEFLEN